MRESMYRDSAKPAPVCVCDGHYVIQAAAWGRGWTGLWNLRCVMCSAPVPLWRWLIAGFLSPKWNRFWVPTGPGPYHNIDPRASDRELRAWGYSEKQIRERT